jgi:hypothetical protein
MELMWRCVLRSQNGANPFRVGRVRSLKAKHNICLRCGTGMNDVVRIEPTWGEPGLIAYECPNCVYVTSVLLEPRTSRRSPGRLGSALHKRASPTSE